MQRRIEARVFWVVFALCIVANLAPYFAFVASEILDGPCQDCIKRIGAPFMFWEEGGYAWRRRFYWNAILSDGAIAVAASLLSTIAFWQRVRISKWIANLKGEARKWWTEVRRDLE